MAQPTTSLSRFVGPLYVGTTPPSKAELGRSPEEGDVYIDVEGSQVTIGVYDGSNWRYTAALESAGTGGTSTSTTTTTTTSTTTTVT